MQQQSSPYRLQRLILQSEEIIHGMDIHGSYPTVLRLHEARLLALDGKAKDALSAASATLGEFLNSYL